MFCYFCEVIWSADFVHPSVCQQDQYYSKCCGRTCVKFWGLLSFGARKSLLDCAVDVDSYPDPYPNFFKFLTQTLTSRGVLCWHSPDGVFVEVWTLLSSLLSAFGQLHCDYWNVALTFCSLHQLTTGLMLHRQTSGVWNLLFLTVMWRISSSSHTAVHSLASWEYTDIVDEDYG